MNISKFSEDMSKNSTPVAIDLDYIRRLFGPESKRYFALLPKDYLESRCDDDIKIICQNYENLHYETFFEDLLEINEIVSQELSKKPGIVRDFKREFSRFVSIFKNPKMNMETKLDTLSHFELYRIFKVIDIVGYPVKHSKIVKTLMQIKSTCDEYRRTPDLRTLVYKLEEHRMFLLEFNIILSLCDNNNIALIFFRYDFKPEFVNPGVSKKENDNLPVMSLNALSCHDFKKLFSVDTERFHLLRPKYALKKMNLRTTAILRMIYHLFEKEYLKNNTNISQIAYSFSLDLLENKFRESDYKNFINKLSSLHEILISNISSYEKAQLIDSYEISFLYDVYLNLGFRYTFSDSLDYQNEEFKILRRVQNLKDISASHLKRRISERKLYTEYAEQADFLYNFIIACKISGYHFSIPTIWRYGIEVKII